MVGEKIFDSEHLSVVDCFTRTPVAPGSMFLELVRARRDARDIRRKTDSASFTGLVMQGEMRA